MKKSVNFLSSFAIILFGLFLTATQAYADIVFPPDIIDDAKLFDGNVLILGAGIVVGVVALVSWLVIRSIRKQKKENAISK